MFLHFLVTSLRSTWRRQGIYTNKMPENYEIVEQPRWNSMLNPGHALYSWNCQNIYVFQYSVRKINIHYSKLHFDLVFCVVSVAVMQEPTVLVIGEWLKAAENFIICLLPVKYTLLFTIICVTQYYMFRTLFWFIFRDFSNLNYIYLTSYLTSTEFFLEWEMFQTKVVHKIKTHILCSITFSRKSCRLGDNVEKFRTARQTTDDNIIRHIRFARSITKATDTHSEYVILIAFPRQQFLRERASILRYPYSACLVTNSSIT
jgi:hypothetical protein